MPRCTGATCCFVFSISGVIVLSWAYTLVAARSPYLRLEKPEEVHEIDPAPILEAAIAYGLCAVLCLVLMVWRWVERGWCQGGKGGRGKSRHKRKRQGSRTQQRDPAAQWRASQEARRLAAGTQAGSSSFDGESVSGAEDSESEDQEQEGLLER